MMQEIFKGLSKLQKTSAIVYMPSGEVVKYQLGVDGVTGFRDSTEGTYVGIEFSEGTKFFCGMPYCLSCGEVPA